MGFLERARSQRGRHQRARSARVEEPIPQGAPSQLQRSATKSKRKSIFPGLSSGNTTTTTCEAGRPRTASARTSSHVSRHDETTALPAMPTNINFPPRNDSFKFPSPALLNENPKKRTPPTSVAHLPTLLDTTSPKSQPASREPSRNPPESKKPPPAARSVTDPVLTKTAREPPPQQMTTWDNLPDTKRWDDLPDTSRWDALPDNRQAPQLKRQKSAWKTLGSLFRSKQPKQPMPEKFYQNQPPSNSSIAVSSKAEESKVGVLESPLPSPVARKWSAVDRVDSAHTSSGRKTASIDKKSLPTNADSRASEMFFEQSTAESSDAPVTPRRTPRLDINIPNSGFDRYSVMFEKQLEPKPSILERRQSKRLAVSTSKGKSSKPSRENLKESEPQLEQQPTSLQRSLTSPGLNRLPSLTIHVANSNYATKKHSTESKRTSSNSQRPRPPKRSTTLPLQATEPLAVPANQTNQARTPVTAIAAPLPESTASSSIRNSLESASSLPTTPTTATSFASSLETTVFSSPSPKTATMNAPTSARPMSIMKLKPTQAQINLRQIQTQSPGSAKTITATPTASSPPPPVPLRSSSRPSLPRTNSSPAPLSGTTASPAPLSGTERFTRQNIVQVSVARQVSVSKARRRVADAVEVKQPLRPRVVELGPSRKSTLLVIEGGD